MATATASQISFIASLMEKRVAPEWVLDLMDSIVEGAPSREASRAIDELKAAPWKPRAAANPAEIAPRGYYKVDGEIYTVCKARNSDNSYAKILVHEGNRGRWEYVRGMVTRLRPENRITLEEAKEFGHLHGFCLVCGKTLTDPKSVEMGIGPICIKRI